MRVQMLAIAVSVLTLLGASCQREVGKNTDGTLADADARQRVEAVLDHVLAAWQAADADALMNFYADDAVWMLPTRSEDLDKEAARTYYRELFLYMTPVDYSAEREIEIDGKTAFARITYRGKLRPKDNPDALVAGYSRHITILRLQADGAWKIWWDIFNLPAIDS